MKKQKSVQELLDNWELPIWLTDCPIGCFDWVIYKGEIYCADLDFDASEKANKPVFNLAYCITKAMNEIWLKTGIVYKNGNIKLTNLGN